jgi:hypothetical protein
MSRPSIGSIHSPFVKGYQELADEELVEKNRALARFGRKRSEIPTHARKVTAELYASFERRLSPVK